LIFSIIPLTLAILWGKDNEQDRLDKAKLLNLKKANHSERVGRKATGLSPEEFRIWRQGCQAKAAFPFADIRSAKKFRYGGAVMLSAHPSKEVLRKGFHHFFVYSLTVFAALVIILPLSIQNTHAAGVTMARNLSPKADIASYCVSSAYGIGRIGLKACAGLYRGISSAGNLSKAKSSMLFFKHKRLRAYRYHHERCKTLKAITRWTLALGFYCLNHLKASCLAVFGITTLFVCVRILSIVIKGNHDFAGRRKAANFPALSARCFLSL